MQTNFYRMKTKSTNYFFALVEEGQTIVKKCPMCGGVWEERKYDKLKVKFKGKKEGDYIFSPDCNIVSLKMLRLLHDNKISGFIENHIVCTEWSDRAGKPLENDSSQYKELIITGTAGCLRTKSGVEIPKCPRCGALRISSYIRNSKEFIVDEEWDGSDMFYFRDWKGPIMVTEKVKNLMEKNKIKNVAFENIGIFMIN